MFETSKRAVGCSEVQAVRMLSPVKHPKALNPVKHCTFDSGTHLCILLLLLTDIGSIKQKITQRANRRGRKFLKINFCM